MALQRGPCQYSSANGLSHTYWQAKSSAQTQSPIGIRRIKLLHLFWKRVALFNIFIKNIHVFYKLVFRKRPRTKCIWKCICQIHQIRWIKYKYKYKYMAWNLIKYKYKYKYAVFVFVFVFANTNTYLTPALVIILLGYMVHGLKYCNWFAFIFRCHKWNFHNFPLPRKHSILPMVTAKLPKLIFCMMILKIILLKLLPHLSRANKLLNYFCFSEGAVDEFPLTSTTTTTKKVGVEIEAHGWF